MNKKSNSKWKNYKLDKRKNPLNTLIVYLRENGFKAVKGGSSWAPLDINNDGIPVIRITFTDDEQITTPGADYSTLNYLANDVYRLNYYYLNQRNYQMDIYQYIDSIENYVYSGYEQAAIDIKGLLLSPYSINYLHKNGCYLSNLSINIDSMTELHEKGHYLHRSILNFSIINQESIVIDDRKTKCINLTIHQIGGDIEKRSN